MVQIVKYFKYFAKFFAILVFVFFFTTFLNGNTIFRPRINRFHIWKVNYDPFNSNTKLHSTKIKYLLIWNKADDEWNCLKDKQIAFKENKCKHDNCYVTKDRNLLGNDVRNFDAILINGRFISDDKNATFKLPEKRFMKQFYVFGMKESADNYPICHSQFDNFFNLTWTYRLDSDAAWPYYGIYNMMGKEVGPRADMDWIFEYDKFDNKEILAEKKYVATWFVSNCYTNSRRESIFNDIKFELLREYKLQVEVVGSCGSSECPKDKDEECLLQLKKYYFYFAFENSISRDYVSEKVIRALLHDTVPIVYGGADYTSFLPPDSYIDAKELGAEKTAATMAYLIHNHTAYLEYFRWRNHYRFGPSTSSVCNLCKLLNKKIHKVYREFREWWNPDYKKTCKITWRSVRSSRKGTSVRSDSSSEAYYKRLMVRQAKTDFLSRKPLWR